MPDKPNLAAALAKTKEETTPTPPPAAPKRPLTGKKATQAQTPSDRAPSRQGQSNISGWFDNSVKFSLDELRTRRQRELGRRVTVNELMAEAYNELFKKYGMPEVAPTKEHVT